MGKTLLVYRLAVRDLRHHAAQAALLVVAIAAAAATLTMALAMNGVTSQPYEATRAATKGPDVVAYLTSTSQATSLVHAPGVAASSGPYLVASGTIQFDGRSAGVFAEGRSEMPATVDQPDVTDGNWVRPGGVVLERTFADALGASVGDAVIVNGQRFTVAGIAVTAAQAPYPNLCYFTASECPPTFIVQGGNSRNVGLIWMTEAGARGLTPHANSLNTTYALNLKLSNPAAADAFAQQRFVPPAQAGGSSGFTPPYVGPLFSTWDGIAAADALLVQDAQSVLEPGSILLAVLAIAAALGKVLTDVNVTLIADIVTSAVAVVALLWLAYAVGKGHDVARVLALIACFYCVIANGIAISQQSATYAPAATIVGGVTCAIGIAVATLLLCKPSSAYFGRRPVAAG